MKPSAARLAGAALVIIVGLWAGAKFRATRVPLPVSHGIPVPAGEASAPNPSDLAQIPGAPLPTPKIPDRLPQFSLTDSAGNTRTISSFEGKSLVINFWATWCAPCRSEIPLLQALHSEWSGRGVSVVGIAVDYRDKVLAYAKRLNIGYPLLIGEQDALDAAAALGFESPVFPFTVFTDRRGEVVTLFVGELHRPEAELILAEVQNLDQNRVQLPAARDAISRGLTQLRAANPG